MKTEIKTNYDMTQGLGLYLPKDYARKWEREHGAEDKKMINVQMPLTMLKALFEIVSAMTAEDVGTLLSRYVGMNETMANWVNRDLNGFLTMLYAQGVRPRLKPNTEPASWKKSDKMGWSD